MGADCKSVGFTFSGSNPLSATSNTMGLQLGAHSVSVRDIPGPASREHPECLEIGHMSILKECGFLNLGRQRVKAKKLVCR
jgi:hypothetical protein